jgi:ABC-2 type transport system permease protein
VSVGGALSVAGVEWSKLMAQWKMRLLLAACAASPFVFAVAMRVQSSTPADTLFGRAVTDSGLAIPLVVLGFGALWPLPVLASIAGGDVFSAEDRYGTWKTVLTRSRSRVEVFSGKVITAFALSVAALAVVGASSIAAGVLVIGTQPLIDLSGLLLQPADAFPRVVAAWASVLLPMWGFTALAVFVSIATRSSAAGVGLPVLVCLTMQLAAIVDGPEAIRRLLIATAFGAWHGLFVQPPFFRPLGDGTVVSGAYLVVCLLAAYRVLRHRDIGQ